VNITYGRTVFISVQTLRLIGSYMQETYAEQLLPLVDPHLT
jgi:hypothetical protein